MPEVKREVVTIDPAHAALRAAIARLRHYASELAKTPRASIRAAEVESRLERALYPREGDRSEPLDALVAKMVRRGLREHRDALVDTLEKLDWVAKDLPEKDPTRLRLRAIADSAEKFLSHEEGADV